MLFNLGHNNENNPLAEFGQLASPKAGSQLKKIEINDEDHQGYFDKIKDRYVWFPLHDISFLGKMAVQPMSFNLLHRGRISWVQPVAYKAVDHSSDALDQQGDDDAPLKTFACTPFAQCDYLHANYASKGFRTLEHFKGSDPKVVAYVEEIVLPDVPTDLISLGKYLSEQSPKNIEVADLDEKTRRLALETLSTMLAGVNDAITYCRNLIAESEGEILTRQNKGVGKAHLDANDRYAYKMTNRPIPTENTLDNSPERKTNELLERLVSALASKGSTEITETVASAKDDEISRLKAELSDFKSQFADLVSLVKASNSSGAPQVEDTEIVPKEVVQEDLARRLDKTKNNNKK